MNIPDNQLEAALEVLSKSCREEYAEAIAYADWMERKARIIKADVFLSFTEGSVAEKEAKALVSDAYKTASEELRMAQTKALIQKAKREDAEIRVRIWQTLQANQRAPNV